MLQLVDHEAVAVAAQAVEGNGGGRHIPAQAPRLSALAGLAGDGRIEREAVRSAVKGFGCLPRFLECGSRGVQAKGAAWT